MVIMSLSYVHLVASRSSERLILGSFSHSRTFYFVLLSPGPFNKITYRDRLRYSESNSHTEAPTDAYHEL